MEKSVFDKLCALSGKKIALIGMGRSHMPLISLFTRYGAQVIACDKRNRDELGDVAEKAKADGACVSLGEHYLDDLDADMAFRTPGMRYYCDELDTLRKKGVVITSEMEMFFDLCPCRIIGVTGSDGKTTTTTVISEFLKKQGYNVYIGGNIGKPLLPLIEEIKCDDMVAVELSSFQLISMRKSPYISLVTNLQENHLDIHKDMQEYIDSKKNILLYQNENDRAVLNMDNDITGSFKDETRADVLMFSRKDKVDHGCFLSGDSIVFAEDGAATPVIDIKDIKIPGMHNVENYMAAICCVWGLVDRDNIEYVAKTFSGVAHRAEFVRELDGVKYYNDSIASSPTRTALGTLSLYDKRIVLIAGGYDKNLDYTDLGKLICSKVKYLILMGKTAGKIENAVVGCSDYDPCSIKICRVNDMKHAVEKAREVSSPGDIVSMSPASASFDLYKDFEARGNHFKELVNNL